MLGSKIGAGEQLPNASCSFVKKKKKTVSRLTDRWVGLDDIASAFDTFCMSPLRISKFIYFLEYENVDSLTSILDVKFNILFFYCLILIRLYLHNGSFESYLIAMHLACVTLRNACS